MKRSILTIIRTGFVGAFALAILVALAGCAGQTTATQQMANAPEELDAIDHPADEETLEAEKKAGSAEGDGNEEGQQGSSAGTGPSQSSHILSNFVTISQYPELPNGCEVTTLAAALNYQGVSVDKTVLSDHHLPKAPVGSANFYREFVGNPRESDAYGCYAPVIVTTAQSYLSSIGSGLSVHNLTGKPLNDLFSYIDQGIPVIVWGTQNNKAGHYSVTWYVDGQELTWFTPEHCMTLIGYDLDSNLVYVADPMTGDQEAYDLSTFRKNYNSLGKQAIVIK